MKRVREIASLARNFSIEDLSYEVIDRAKLLLLDSLTAIAYGNKHEKMVALANNMALDEQRGSEGTVPVFGTNNQLNYRDAALLNGTGMVADELDEGNPLAKGHPAAHFLPALFS